ncbi:Fe-S cluster assembly protein SufD [Bartonella henselae]|uniref:SUF system FeS cluster assembly SufBD core domain-containing protein n=1 Tax=Bartonella henselae (strain ATCC 49882 / DSM 28221 / CCUG 30454 / Houston 1) TaxID=283166 RepID=A0A0H3M5R3_BARHE|nr:Fe-S cluster assembly protein SufD [Bartonella henselae]ATP12368.1 Fe-S cluster assembly protein SufD [Bartonella henselae]ETS08541.1 FeS assembly protein SufD [Bartonella henselae JK 51]ETS09088.1 FeS assembly protein SufD [Bartonella henselae JK 50]MDM9991112.1 Fe-S cluster assembly protein SufD [Bartonella henselae]OLL37767.1 ABC transporter ATP-binding protein [Bartonella henselae]
MNVNSQQELLTVEEDILKNFNQYVSNLPGDKTVQVIRKRAIELFKTTRLPSRKIESWHYTNLRTLLKSVSHFSPENNGQLVGGLLSESQVFSIENGKTLTHPEISDVTIKRLAEELEKESAKIDFVTSDEDFIGQLNIAFVTDGWLFHIPENTKLNVPIELQNIQMGGQSHTFSDIKMDKNSQAVFVEHQTGDDKETFISSIFSLNVAAYGEVTWILIRNRGFNSTQFGKFRAVLGQGAKLSLYVINIGSQLNRQEIDVELQGEESDFQLRVINLLSGQTHSDLTMTVRHIEEKSTSTEIVRNVVTDKAVGVFQGIIRVAQKAQKTDARMACNSLILSDDAEFNAKPELEIFADDVVCGHGATVANINCDHLFYLMARGIPFKTARALLIKGFVSELIDDIKQENIQTILENITGKWLEKNV